MMKLFSQLRIVVVLKRLNSNLEKAMEQNRQLTEQLIELQRESNRLRELTLVLSHPAWARSGGLERIKEGGPLHSGNPKFAGISSLDVETLNKKWNEAHPEPEDYDF